jgi:hypothetical protein
MNLLFVGQPVLAQKLPYHQVQLGGVQALEAPAGKDHLQAHLRRPGLL